jgi:hypothetical protein
MCRVRSNIALALVAVLLSADFASAGLRDWFQARGRRARVSCPGGACGGPTGYCPCVEPAKCSPQYCPTTSPYPLPTSGVIQVGGCPDGKCPKLPTLYGK